MLGAESLSPAEQLDHFAHGILRCLHEIRADPHRHVIAFFIQMAADGPTRQKSREPQVASLDEVNVRRDAHGRLDGGSANLTVSLSGVRISDGEQCALHFDRQIQLHALAEVANIHIAAGLVRRDGAEAAGFGTGDTDGPAEWLQWYASPFPIGGGCAEGAVIAPDVKGKGGKIRCDQPKPELSNPSSVTFNVSPGSAPSTYTGPAIGLIRSRSSVERSSTVDLAVIWPHMASMSSNCTESPGAIVMAGRRALSQLRCC